MIEAYFDARSFGSKGTSIAVCIKRNEFKWTRTINCGKITSNQAELKAVEYILKSIKLSFTNDPVVFHTSGRYAKMMLERNSDGSFKRDSRINQDLLDEVYVQVGNFNNLSFDLSTDVNWLKEINTNAIKGDDVFIREEE
jgi:ribonuclease HI